MQEQLRQAHLCGQQEVAHVAAGFIMRSWGLDPAEEPMIFRVLEHRLLIQSSQIKEPKNEDRQNDRQREMPILPRRDRPC